MSVKYNPHDLMGETIDRLATIEHSDVPHIVMTIRAALDAPASGTMAGWFGARDGATVDTIQVNLEDGGTWTPLARVVDSTSARGSVKLNGSSRDYARMRVLHSTPEALIVTDNSWHVVAYVMRETTS